MGEGATEDLDPPGPWRTPGFLRPLHGPSDGLPVSITLVERVCDSSAALLSRCHGNLHSTHLIHTSRLAGSRQRSQTGICPLFPASCVFQTLKNGDREIVGLVGGSRVMCVRRLRLCCQGQELGVFKK